MALLTMVSMGAWADVDVLLNKEYEGGKVAEILQEESESGGTTVYITVSPAEGFTVKMEDVHVEPVIPASSQSSTRTPELAKELTLSGSKKTVSYPNYAVYSFTVPDGLNAWVKNVEFQKKREGAKGGEFTLTYHIINLGKLDNSGKLTSVRTEALQFTSDESKVAVPDKYKSPLAKNWKYYSASDVTFDQDTRACTFISGPSLNETDQLTLTANTDIYVTYELDENALNTVGLADGGIYRISRSGKKFLYQSHWQGDPNVYFDTSDKSTSPTDAIYLWKFNIVDPYQITIQSKSADYYDYYLSSKAGSFGDIRLRNPLGTAKENKVWSFGLLNGESGYRLIITDGYKLAPDGTNGLDEFGHGYLNNNDSGKARFQKYGGNEYKNSDLTFVPLERTYTYNIVNQQGNIAISEELTQAVGKLSGYNDIPESIRSSYINGETVTFYSFTGDYSSANLSDENIITEMPLTDANIYVTYTTDLTGKFLNLNGAHAYNIKVGDNYIYDSGSGTLSDDSSEANKGNTNHLWYFTGGDPYSIQVVNVATGYYLNSSSSTLSLSTTTESFILISSNSGEGYEQIGLKNATGDIIQMNALAISGLSVNYYLIDKAGKLIFDPQSSTSEELALPSEWVSPLVSKYHYYKTITYDDVAKTYTNPTDEISSPAEVGGGGDIYVTYDVSNTIDIKGKKTYLLKFSEGGSFNQEDGVDGVMEGESNKRKAIYPYNNGDFNLYVYGQERWEQQLQDGASTRSRWLWHFVSTQKENDEIVPDPYHVVIQSYQNQSLKLKEGNVETSYPGKTYLRTYKPENYSSVVTGTAYENETYPNNMPNDQPTEYMILGTSLNNMKLQTVNKINDGITEERRTVTTFEQYWKNTPTVYNILKGAGYETDGKGVNEELSADEKAVLTARGWHTYQAWANAANWSSDPNPAKSLADGKHWFQTIDMGSGVFSVEEVELNPVLILLDQHGWEVVRINLPHGPNDPDRAARYAALHKYNSPMVATYHYYKTAVKATGYHKYTVDLNSYATVSATNNTEYTTQELGVLDGDNGNLPDYSSQALDAKGKERDWYVTYDVKPVYASSYKGAATEDAISASAFLIKQNDKYASIASATSTSITQADDAPANKEDTPDNMLWYLKPNYNIDTEMGYKYAGEIGAQNDAKSKAVAEADYVANGQNGFDPYNLQIQSKAYPSRYFTANTTGSALDGGAWKGTSSNVELQNLRTDRQTANSYDHTTLSITNATFMVVDDGFGNMRLMPRFDNQSVMSSFALAAPLTSADVTQSLVIEKVEKAKVIHSSNEIDPNDMDGNYVLAADFTFTSGYTSLGTESTPFRGTIDGQLYAITAPSVPLVAYAGGSATIKNVILENVNISGGTNVGAICNVAVGSTRIYNCGVLSGSIGGSNYVGGIVGKLDDASRVINCYSYATITGGTVVGGIVGYNNATTKAGSINTMVMNCMFYGDITGGSTVSPIYGGNNIANLTHNSDRAQDGLNTFNYYAYEKLKTKAISNNKYNSALAVEDKYLTRFEYYRLLLNSNKKLAAFYATGSPDNADQMAKWVLETADRTIDDPKPYPVLKAQGYYPSIINPDFENAPSAESAGRNKGGKLGKTLTVTISGVGSNAPSGASITTGSLTLQRTDKDFDRFNFNYDKVQLPYYNDVGEGNYTEYKVVTGWKITAITAVDGDPYTSANYPTTGVKDFPDHNYADRKSSNKDLYSVSGRVFSQGAYFDVPYGVTNITIEPYWANAIYVADANYDVVYKGDYSGKQNVTQTGTQAVDNTTTFNGQKIRTSITGLGSGTTVYDNAVVLVGNFHLDGVPSNGDKPFTMMSVDEDNDHEPDYSLIYHHKSRSAICPIRFDFLNIPGTAQAQKPNGANLICNFTIFKTKGWFEVTNTSSFYSSQLEYENLDGVSKSDAPLILQGGVIDQFVSTQNKSVTGKTIYIHLGGNVWIKEFGMGTHSDGKESTPHVPVSVTGGEFPGFYLTGTYKADANVRKDNAECYISGGYIHEAAGASLEQIDGNVHWQIYNADIDNFFGGGINDAKPITGNITTDIFNSHVTLFCGGPKFGNMQTDKTVTTNAEGCTFEKFFGAGYGGTSIAKKKYYDKDGTQNWGTLQGYYTTDRGKYFDGATTGSSQTSGKDYGKKGPGVATDFDYEFFVWTSGSTGARLYVNFASFSLAQCNDVSSTLKNCTVETNFYGGGNLGKVVGTATSVLEDCTVKGSVYGAGYSASLPTVEVRDAGFTTNPNYNSQSGMFEPGVFSGTTTFTWQNAAAAGKTLTNGQFGSDLSNHILYTNTVLTGLGEVAKSVLTINGTTTVAGSVYGGGEESNVSGNTNVNICAKDEEGAYVAVPGNPVISGNVYGGGKGVILDAGEGSFECAKAMVGINGDGTNNPDGGTTVNITAGTVKGNVYGGGEVGRVEKNTSVTIGTVEGSENNPRSPIIEGSVFGAGKGKNTHGYSALVRGNTTVTVQGDTWVKQSVYGGGEIASVGRYKVDETTGLPTVPNGGGKCTVTIQGYAEIGPNDMKMTAEGGPNDAGHVFGAGKGVLPYEGYDDSAQPQHMDGIKDANGNWEDNPKKYTAYNQIAANEVDEDYFKFIKTLALASDTEVTIGGHAFVKGSVYGGSENGFVQADTHVTIKEDCQIGNGDDVNRRYTTAEWAYDGSSNNTSLKECASWSYASPYSPYDKYADVNGYDAKGGAVTATDGHTFYGNVFGGGSGYYPYRPGKWFEHAGAVYGKTQVDITGGHILTSVYGGNEMTDVKGSCTVNMTGGTVGVPRTHEQMRNHPVTCYVFGAGKGDQRRFFNTWTNVASTEVKISGKARIYGSTFGGGEDGHVIGNAVTTIEKGADVGSGETIRYPYIGTTGTSAVDGNIFGGGRGFSETALTAGVVGGNVEVNISDGTILGSVFGGGRLASVGTFFANETDANYGKMQEDEENVTHGHIKINISGGSIGAVDGSGNLKNSNYTIGDVFGGCKGSSNNNADSHKFGLAKNTEITISGTAKINRSVFGGGEAGNVTGHVTVTLEGGTVGEDVYGGGALADTNIANWDFDESKNTWAENKTSASNTTTVNLYGGTIKGDAFGGGLGQKTGFNGADSDIEATTYGDITVNLGTQEIPATNESPAVPATATAFNITYDNSGTADAPVQVVKSGRLFGTNNLNGSPKGNVTVNVYKTVKRFDGVSRTAADSEDSNKANRTDAVPHNYEVAAVYGGGNLADYTATDKKASVTIHTCEVSVQDVYGGGNAAKVPETDVLVKGAWEIEHVFGGGNGKDKYKKGNAWIENAGADVTGNTNTLMIGGYIHEAYGGSNEKGTIGGNVYLNTNAEDDRCDCSLELEKIVGAGKNAEVWGDIITVLGCQPETLVPEYIGGADNADVHGNVELTITSGTFGKVFGGNNIGGVIEGHIKVNIEETGCRPIVIGELYGCGNDAAYSVYGYNADGTCKTEGTKIYADPEVNVISCTSIGKVFGGGLGEHATVYGSPTVNINQTYGKAYTSGGNPEYTAVASSLGEIGEVFGGGNEANVYGDTHVNIGTKTTVTLTSQVDSNNQHLTANVIGANITGNVYGGGNKANVSGNTNVVIGKQAY